MNKQRYRVIFRKASGTFIAVAETTAAQGKHGGRGQVGATQTPFSLMRFATLSALVSALSGHVTFAHAQMVAYKNGAGPRPVIDQSGNGRERMTLVRHS